jgi:hypothetical protein
MKSKNKDQLRNVDFPKYCKQIGILDSEVPRLVFNRKEYVAIAAKRGHKESVKKDRLGECFWQARVIFVNESPHLKNGILHRKIQGKGRMKRYYKWVPKKWNYYEQRHTLVHELVHQRFPQMQHGRAFDDRIDEIIAGKTFEPKHIHFFAAYDKRQTYLIDGSTNEEIEKYLQTQAKANVTREAYNAKLDQYWKLRKELEAMLMSPFTSESEASKYPDWQTQQEIRDLIEKTKYKCIPLEQTIEQLQRKKEEVVSIHIHN